jgi:hypothetical protein
MKNAGLVGEGLFDERVWIIKSHYPESMSPLRYFNQRIILLVRNPLDCLVAYFDSICTESNT